MINYLYTITNQRGDVLKINDHVTDPLNFIALQDYPEMDVDIKNAESDKEGQHGIWDFYSFYGKRTITFSGIIVGEDEGEVETLKQALNNVFSLPVLPSDGNDGTVTIAWEDANGDGFQVEGKIYRSIRFSRALKKQLQLSFLVTVKCPTPFILGDTLNTSNGTRGYRNVTWTLPVLLPFVTGLGYYNKLTVNNAGSVMADTVIRLNGEAGSITNPKITNTTTGAFMQVETTILDGHWIEMDSEAGTIVDQDGNDLSALVTADSNFVLLSGGDNDLMYESDENPYATLVLPTATFSVAYRNTSI
jgi:hypothetical protein